MEHIKSTDWFNRAISAIAGGVNSPARSFRAVGGDPPIVMASAQGAWFEDVDHNRYIDYLAAFGPLVLGHNHPRVNRAIADALGRGPLWGTPAPDEIELAETLVHAIPGCERIRLTTTGTEAVMSVIRLARAFTGRPLVVKFDGAYHGHSDPVLVEAGSGAATGGTANSLGVPRGVTQDVRSIPFNDPEALRQTLHREGERVALVLTEPVVGNMGIVPPKPGYLEEMIRLAHAAGALVCFDEVITAFRFHWGSAAELLGVRPDLFALGKTIGGGLPQGGYGGRRDIMEMVAPLGGVFQAGTLAGNPLSAAAGLATLAVLRDESPYERMDRLAARLCDGLLSLGRERGVPMTINRMGSAFTLFFGAHPVDDYQSAQATDAERFGRFHRLMLERGVYLAPSRYEAWFVSAAHGPDEIARTLEAARDALKRL